MNHPVEMFDYHAWANQTVLGRIEELPSDVLTQEVNSSFPTLAHALGHMYAVDKMWHLVLTGMSMPEALEATYPLAEANLSNSAAEFAAIFAQSADAFRACFRRQPDLERTIRLDNPYAGLRDTRLSEIVLHVVNHGTYHRGNISTMLRQLGHASIMHDYAFFWYRKPVEAN